MKIYRYIATGVLAAALSAGSGMAQTVLTNSYTNSFPNGGNTSLFTGGSVASWIEWYGLSFGNTAMQCDPTNDAAGDPTSGSLFLSLPFSGPSQQVQIQGTFDNNYGYDDTAVIPLNIITNTAFDVFVDPSTPKDGNGNFGSVQMSLIDPGNGNGGRDVPVSSITIPGSASGHWQHVQDTNVVAEAQAMINAGYTQAAGIGFYINSFNGTYPVAPMKLWIDNVSVQTLTAPPPPPPNPTLALPVKTIQGLNVFNTTEGNGFFDRQEVELVNKTGLAWVGQTGGGPVSYSFTISSFPNQGAFAGEAYMFLVPSPAALEGAPDYNEANCAVVEIQRTATGGQAVFQYKVNEAAGNDMYFAHNGYTNAPGSWPGTSPLTQSGTNVWQENGTLTNVQSATVTGTWTLQFTTDTNGALIAPDGTVANFVIPPYYGTNFAGSANFNIYLGGQANSAGYMNQAVVYSGFAISGLGAANMNETFTGETTLNTNVWVNTYATGPGGVLIVAPTTPYLVSWGLPATGFSLQDSAKVGASSLWKNVSTFPIIPMHNTNSQFISTADITGANSEYFRLIKRSFSQLLILLPGQTNTPGVAPGYTGTPTALSLAGNQFVEEIVTVLAVDSQWNPIPGIIDNISLVSGPGADSNEILPANGSAMVNGSVTFGASNPFFFSDQGNWTVSATNTSNTNIPLATSATVTVGP